jgi:DNA-binding NtrC family response regulator
MPKFNPFNKGRIFIVDEPIVSSAFAGILRREDFAVTAFTDGMKALQAARSEAPDLLISEVAMWPLSEIDLAVRLQTRHPSCKILLFSGQSGSAESLEMARNNGLEFEVIPKPVDPRELLKRVRDMTEGASRSAAKALASKTYNDNMQQAVSRLKERFGIPEKNQSTPFR